MSGKTYLLVTAALVAAVAVLVVSGLPPRQLTLEASFDDGTIAGEIHVHTNRSDGLSAPEHVAEAAARAGLKFIIFTDHGDATRTPDPPAYRSGVLCLDAVEISTGGGHYLALDMPPSPYPLGGDARGVVEDVKRLGGFGVVAHPNSPKADLSWDAWDLAFDAIEWLNPDTSWRVKAGVPGWRTRWNIVTTLVGYPFRSPETIARLMGGTELGAGRWESFSRLRRVVLLAGADAHARLALAGGEPRDRGVSLPLPGYESSFRSLSVHVRPDRALTGDPARDATTILQALRRGHLYIALDGVAGPPAFEFSATNAKGTAREGDEIEEGGPVSLRLHSNAPSEFFTRLYRDGTLLTTAPDVSEITRTEPADPGIYRAEIVAPPSQGSVPWIVSNPIYVGMRFPRAAEPVNIVSSARTLFDGRTTKWWRTEVDATSLAAIDIAPTISAGELRMRYGLSGGTSAGQYAALGLELPTGAAPYDRVTFTARSEQPIRVAVQFQPLGRAQVWEQSIYMDATSRVYTIRFDEVLPIGPTRAAHPDPEHIHDILWVVDTRHAKPGASNTFWVSGAALQR